MLTYKIYTSPAASRSERNTHRFVDDHDSSAQKLECVRVLVQVVAKQTGVADVDRDLLVDTSYIHVYVGIFRTRYSALPAGSEGGPPAAGNVLLLPALLPFKFKILFQKI